MHFCILLTQQNGTDQNAIFNPTLCSYVYHHSSHSNCQFLLHTLIAPFFSTACTVGGVVCTRNMEIWRYVVCNSHFVAIPEPLPNLPITVSTKNRSSFLCWHQQLFFYLVNTHYTTYFLYLIRKQKNLTDLFYASLNIFLFYF